MSDFDSDDSVKDPNYEPSANDSDSASARTVPETTSIDSKRDSDKSVGSDSVSSVTRSKFNAYFAFTVISKGNKIAVCLLCKKKKRNVEFKIKDSSTSNLKRHLKSVHIQEYKVLFPNIEESQPGSTSSRDSQQITLKEMFQSKVSLQKRGSTDTENISDTIVDWVAIKYLPFSFFDDEPTQTFFSRVHPSIKLPGRKALKRMVLSRFTIFQEKVMTTLQNNTSKISFTIDGWTSINNKSYYGITAHFIDKNWTLRSLVIDFVPSKGQHSGKDIANIFITSLRQYGIESKVQGVTVDNAAANTTFMQQLGLLIRNFDSENQHFRCMAHILNLAVQDLLKTLNLLYENRVEDEDTSTESENENNYDSDDEQEGTVYERATLNFIEKIRLISKKIKRSEQLQLRFKSACEIAGVPSEITPVLDVPTRWNSTQDMLEVALKLKMGINCLCDNNPLLKDLKPSNDEWSVAKEVQRFLKIFKKVSEKLGGDTYVTLPYVVVSINMLLDVLEAEAKKLDEKVDRSRADETLLLALQNARDKILKHYQLTNWVYCAVLILDPRHKLELFEFTSWGKALKNTSYSVFMDLCKRYKNEQRPIALSTFSDATNDDKDDEFDLNQLYKTKKLKTSDETEEEISKYLSTPRCNATEDILNWWKINQKQYPILSAVAKDLFSITATSVPAERLFSRAGLIIRKQRNRLSAESARSLLCLNSWVKSKTIFEN